MAGLQTPVAFFIFNRPEHTQQCLAALALVQPQTLLVVGDAARSEAEQALVIQTRNLLQQVDWPCSIITHFATENMGCRLRVSSGLHWVFEQVEEAIILEDDCIADPSFFHFCEAMLSKYKNHLSIAHISGNHFDTKNISTNQNWYFSNYPHVWGWATWRRAWEAYDVHLNQLDENSLKQLNQVFSHDKDQARFWINKIKKEKELGFDTWDYQWLFAIWNKGWYSITPTKNLVKNIGFDEFATHTKDPNEIILNMSLESMNDFTAPDQISINHQADDDFFYSWFIPKKNPTPSIMERINRKLLNWLESIRG